MNTHPDPEQLSAYVDGQLDGAEREDLEQHLTGCSECSSTVRAIRATLADLRALPTPAPSETDVWRLRAAITKRRKKPAARYRGWVAAASVAAAAIAVVVVVNVGKTSSKLTHSKEATGAGALTAPATLPSVEVFSYNYSASAAAGLLQRAPVMAPPAQPRAATPAPGTVNGTTTNTYDSLVSSFRSQIQNCESTIFAASTSRPTPYRYVVANYVADNRETPAFFLVYEVGSGDNSKLELYVVQQSDCYIRLFLPPR